MPSGWQRTFYVTKVTYQPQHDSNEEFVELTNIGAQTINLNLLKFTEGIDFTFPSIEPAPSEHIVVVQDREAFEAKHGTEGEYFRSIYQSSNFIP